MSWLNWSVTIGLELTTVSILMKRWFPDVQSWIWCLLFGVILFIINALSSKSFAEVEFWFASIKVVTIIAFILLGGAAMFGFIHMHGHKAPMLSNFTDHGGLFPKGIMAILVTMIAVNFSFQGTELVGVAAGESDDPAKAVPKAVKNTVWRILLFFILSMFVLAGLFPWDKVGLDDSLVASPFVVVFDRIGIPYAADILNFVIITAVLSVANSGLYATARMLFSMSKKGMVSPVFGKLSKRGVPLNALIFSMLFGCLSLLCGTFSPDKVYVWLISIAGFGCVFVWASIALSNYLGRKKYIQEGGKVEDLKYKTPLYPFVPLLAFALNMITMISLVFIPDQRMAIYCGVPFAIACYIFYHLVAKKKNIDLTDTKEEVSKIAN
jgi:arginine/ornithine permease